MTDKRTGPSCRAITSPIQTAVSGKSCRPPDSRYPARLKPCSGSDPTAPDVPAGAGRLGLGPTRDVVMIDAELEHVYNVDEVPAGLARGYAAQAGWDPRESGESMRFLVLRPLRIQAWREPDELPGRTLMRGGAWIP